MADGVGSEGAGRAPVVTVIMPVHNGMGVLPSSVRALLESSLSRPRWEFVVVDDASTDGSSDWAAAFADRVLHVSGGPRGPGFARNLAAREALGPILAFVDADVCVHSNCLALFEEAFGEDERLGATFGTYDDAPKAQGFVSQYRNLYHRYVHLQGAGESESFWAGLGAVRRDLFLRIGGFDTATYRRPQIEDIELGYRIRRAGYRIVLDPRIQGSHLKKWTLTGVIKTDLMDRGIPWMRLLLRDGGGQRSHLNVGGGESLKVILMGLACGSGLGGAVSGEPRLLLASLSMLAAITALNTPLYRWFAETRGWGFALRVIPMNLLYYLSNAVSVVVGFLLHVLAPAPGTKAEAGPAGG